MAARVQIVLEMDDRGVVSAFQGIGDRVNKLPSSLERLGSKSNAVMNGMTNDHMRARQAAIVLSRTLGVELPIGLERMLVHLKPVAAAMGVAFNAALVLGVGAAIVQAINHIDEWGAAVVKAGENVQLAGDRIREWLGFGKSMQALAADVMKQQALALPLIQAEADARKQAALVGLEGFAKIAEARRQELLILKQLEDKQGLAAVDEFKNQEKLQAALTVIRKNAAQARADIEERFDKEAVLEARKRADTIREAENAARLSGMRGIEAIEEKARQDAEKLDIAFFDRQLITQQEFQKKRAALDKQTENEIENFRRGIEKEAIAARWAAAIQGAHGIAQIEKQLQAELEAIGLEEFEKGMMLTAKRAAAREAASNKIAQIEREAARETLRIEEDAALALVPEWQRAYAQISVDTSQRLRDIDLAFNRTEITGEDAARRTAAVWAQAGAQMRNQLANDLERAFDDLTSGRLWETILRQFKHMVFQMIAQWILGQRAMAASTGVGSQASGGFSLGGLLGSLFGIGGGSRSGGGLAPGVIQNFAGGGGSTSRGGGFQFGSFMPGVAGLGGLAGLPMSAGGNLSAAGSIGTGTALPAGASLLTRFRGNALSSGQGLLAGGIGMAGVFGGQAVGFGGPGRGALAGGLMGAGLVGGTIAALWGSAVGSAGAAMGALLFGPLGIGIIAAGALLGLFMGMKNRDKQKAQAMDILNQGRAEWKKVISDFEGHRIDYGSAVAGVTQVWQQMVQQWSSPSLGKYGGIAIQNNAPEFRRTLQQIEDLQVKRQWTAQSPMYGAAGEFSSGGFVSPSLSRPIGPLGIPPMPSGLRALPHFAGGGAVPIIAHTGEFVMQRSAVQRIGRGKLEAMNAGGSRGGGPMIVVQGPLVQAAPGMSTEQLAEATIRKLERLLRDQGVSLRA